MKQLNLRGKIVCAARVDYNLLTILDIERIDDIHDFLNTPHFLTS